jgi:hypothetical protein
LKISALSKKTKSPRVRIRGSSNTSAPGPRVRQSAFWNAGKRSDAELVEDLSDKSVTTENQAVRQILTDKLRALIEHRNSIVDAPNFARNLKAKGEIFEGNEAEGLEAIDNKLDALERQLDGQDHVTQRFNRTKEMLARFEREFAEYRRILEGHDGDTR